MIKTILIIWCICAIIAVVDRMSKGTAYIFKYNHVPDTNDIMLEYLFIIFMSPVILIGKYIWAK